MDETSEKLLPREILDAAQSAFKVCFGQFADMNQTRLSDECLTAIIKVAGVSVELSCRTALKTAREALLSSGFIGAHENGEGDPEINQIDAVLTLPSGPAIPVSQPPSLGEEDLRAALRWYADKVKTWDQSALIHDNGSRAKAALKSPRAPEGEKAAEARVSVPEDLQDMLAEAANRLRDVDNRAFAESVDQAADLLGAPQGASVSPRVADMRGALEKIEKVLRNPEINDHSRLDQITTITQHYLAAPSSPVSRLIAGETEACAKLADNYVGERMGSDDWAAGYKAAAIEIRDAIQARLSKIDGRSVLTGTEAQEPEIDLNSPEETLPQIKAKLAHVQKLMGEYTSWGAGYGELSKDHKRLTTKLTRLCKSEDRPAQEDQL